MEHLDLDDDSLPDFDVQGLWDRLDGDVEALVRLLEMFQEEFPIRVMELKDSLDRGDLEGASKCAHSLKGLCASMGAEKLRRLMAGAEKDPLSASGDFFRAVSLCFLRFVKISEDLRRRWIG
ncbi:HPt domain-containing protein [Thermanaerovibrio velox DSM 12556]|uniref:HPt domain-containing protein n=1 Tax=Thermanaerovibrio velox DSM 12556 TaxID=926567 RepID=H0UP44_9BACT|nr:Hpt domain-containing protein [Thermanaerovibrio velox]EHM10547.1 HPt domain-containing protein [Thermanaerovibrio velox DSM 12556]